MTTSIKWNGKEVEGKWRRALIVGVVSIVVVVLLAVSLLLLAFGILLAAILIPVIIIAVAFEQLFRRNR